MSVSVKPIRVNNFVAKATKQASFFKAKGQKVETPKLR